VDGIIAGKGFCVKEYEKKVVTRYNIRNEKRRYIRWLAKRYKE
jgi:hypothetical protein